MSGLYGRGPREQPRFGQPKWRFRPMGARLLMHVVEQSTQPTQQLLAAGRQGAGAVGAASAV